MEGRPTFSRSATLYFRADLAEVLADRKWAVVYVNNDRMRGFFRFEKPFDRAFLAINTLGPPDAPDTDVTRDLTEHRAGELVRLALGNDAVDVQIERIMAWDAAAQTAARFRHGRVFLAGDAAHVMPPTGGFGGNTGVQDAHNLAWKMALVLHGAADETLLDTYEAERRPVATLTVDQAYVRYALRTDRTLVTPSLSPLIDDLDIELGYIYRSAAVASELGSAPGHLSPRETHGLPGSRAPHLLLTRNGAQCSTLDLYGEGFTLLGGPDAEDWVAAARSAAPDIGVPLHAWRPGADGLEDPSGELPERHGIAADGCVLVRPDGFVAWRARDDANASPERISSILRKILGIPTSTA
jgi:putative polyketide hydroxylase